jgi:hypothetical protein
MCAANRIMVESKMEFESPKVRVRVLLFGPVRFILKTIGIQQMPDPLNVAFFYVRHKQGRSPYSSSFDAPSSESCFPS